MTDSTKSGTPKRFLFGIWLVATAGSFFALDYESRMQFGQGSAIGTVDKVEGIAQYRASNLPVWLYARGKQLVYDDNVVATGNRSSATISFSDGRSLNIQPNSQVAISSKRDTSNGESAFVVALLSGAVALSKNPTASSDGAQGSPRPIILKVQDKEIKISDPKTSLKVANSDNGAPMVKISGGDAELSTAGSQTQPIAISSGQAVSLPAPAAAAIQLMAGGEAAGVKIVQTPPDVDTPDLAASNEGSAATAANTPNAPVAAETEPVSANQENVDEAMVSLDGDDYVRAPVKEEVVTTNPPPMMMTPEVAVTPTPSPTRVVKNIEVIAPKPKSMLWTFADGFEDDLPTLIVTLPKSEDGILHEITPVDSTEPKFLEELLDDGTGRFNILGNSLKRFGRPGLRNGVPILSLNLKLNVVDHLGTDQVGGQNHRIDLARLKDLTDQPVRIDLGLDKSPLNLGPGWFSEATEIPDNQKQLSVEAQGKTIAPILRELINSRTTFKLTVGPKPEKEGLFVVKGGRIIAAIKTKATDHEKATNIARRLGGDLMFKGDRSALIDPAKLIARGEGFKSADLRGSDSIYAAVGGDLEEINSSVILESEAARDLILSEALAVFVKDVKVTFLQDP